MPKVQIDKNEVLSPGDRVELHFRTTGMAWIKATQIALIESRAKGRGDWKIIRFKEWPDQPTLLVMEIEIISEVADEPEMQTAGIGITAIIITASISAIGAIVWLTLEKVYQITAKVIESPAASVAAAGTGIGLAAAGIAALLLFVLPKK